MPEGGGMFSSAHVLTSEQCFAMKEEKEGKKREAKERRKAERKEKHRLREAEKRKKIEERQWKAQEREEKKKFKQLKKSLKPRPRKVDQQDWWELHKCEQSSERRNIKCWMCCVSWRMALLLMCIISWNYAKYIVGQHNMICYQVYWVVDNKWKWVKW